MLYLQRQEAVLLRFGMETQAWQSSEQVQGAAAACSTGDESHCWMALMLKRTLHKQAPPMQLALLLGLCSTWTCALIFASS